MKHNPASTRWAIGASLAVLAGCGGGDASDPTGSTPAPEPAATPTATPAPTLTSQPQVTPGPLGATPAPPVCGSADLSAVRTPIYVAPDGTDSDTCGSSASNACASAIHAVDRCAGAGAGCGVLVRWGRYTMTSTLALRAGVSVYGSCRFDGEADQRYRSTLVGPADKPAVSAVGIVQATTFEGFQVLAGHAKTHGSASIAMLVRDSIALQLNRSQLVGGIGGDGVDGGNGAMGFNGGDAGGSDKRNAGASAGPGLGGTGGASSIDGANCSLTAATAGGKVDDFGLGGGAAPSTWNGIWCAGRPRDNPGDGSDGGAGTVGGTGPAVAASNQVTGTLGSDGRWTAGKGADGISGTAGSGGGGGAAGGACEDGTNNYPGGPGGGGGGGGTGGGGGGGGQHGGGSLALLLVSSTLAAQGPSLVPGVGGNGGRGGDGAPGGAGGAGAAGEKFPGGRNTFWGHLCPGVGGNGGAGGAGGGGSPGAAGNGGPAIALATLGSSSVPDGLARMYLGAAGDAGGAGIGGVKGWWRKAADEGGQFAAPTGWVRYGADSRWRLKYVQAGTMACNTTTFGGDPAFGTVKMCQFADFVNIVAGEGQTFGVTDTVNVTYGSSAGSVTKTVGPGVAACTVAFFGTDPSPGVPKQCQMFNAQAGAAGAAAPGANARVVDFDLPPPSTLYAGQSIAIGGVLWSPSRSYQLLMQNDNNLALYTGSGAYRWDANTPHTGAARLLMRDDGAAVLVDANGGVHWSSSTAGHPGAYLRLGDDGKVAIVESGNVLWRKP